MKARPPSWRLCFFSASHLFNSSPGRREPAPVKKAARKVKQPAAPVVETVAAEVIEQPAPGVITVTGVEETELRKVS
jgi:hypothetical protein